MKHRPSSRAVKCHQCVAFGEIISLMIDRTVHELWHISRPTEFVKEIDQKVEYAEIDFYFLRNRRYFKGHL